MDRLVDNTYLHAIAACVSGTAKNPLQIVTFLRFVGEVLASERLFYTVDRLGPVYKRTQETHNMLGECGLGEVICPFEPSGERYRIAWDAASQLLAVELDFLQEASSTYPSVADPEFSGADPDASIHDMITDMSIRDQASAARESPASSRTAIAILGSEAVLGVVRSRLGAGRWGPADTKAAATAARMLAYEVASKGIGSYLPASGRAVQHALLPIRDSSTSLRFKDGRKHESAPRIANLPDLVDAIIVRGQGNPRNVLMLASELRKETSVLRKTLTADVPAVGDALCEVTHQSIQDFQSILDSLIGLKPKPSLAAALAPTLVFSGVPPVRVEVTRLREWISYKRDLKLVKPVALALMSADGYDRSEVHRRLQAFSSGSLR